MQAESVTAEQCDLVRTGDLGGIELTRATYRRHTFSRHAHEGFAIGVIERGAGVVNHPTGEVAPAGCITVLHPDQPHAGAPVHGLSLTYRSFNLSGATVDRLLDREPGSGTPTFRSIVIHDAPLARRLRLVHGALPDEPDPLQRESALISVMGDLFARHSHVHRPARHATSERAAVGRVRAFLNAEYARRVTLAELTRLVGLSESHLLRVFRTETGLPPYAYVIGRRIAAAKTRLCLGEPLPHIALACGFVDQSHLTRHFTRIVGMPPGRYARAAMKKPP